ncbi:MAG: competence/damage-inducible protein A [Coriobacteriia bacterium]
MTMVAGLSISGSSAAILAVGTELTTGIVPDTNTHDVATALTEAGYTVTAVMIVPDDADAVEEATRNLLRQVDLLVVTGGLGPTHDDITREAVAAALDLALVPDETLAEGLRAVADAHESPESAEGVMRQAMVLEGASVIPASSGTAPGQVVEVRGRVVALLPGPPHEMAPMLHTLIEALPAPTHAPPVILSCSDIYEVDAQVAAERVLRRFTGIALTVLAGLGNVRIVLRDEGAGAAALDAAALAIRDELGDRCLAGSGQEVAERLVSDAVRLGARLACAESCTGGLVGAAITSVPGSSAAFRGGVTAYSNEAKTALLGVPAELIGSRGAVSEEVASAMAAGAGERLAATHTVAVTGIAGPDGGSEEKPVGTVCFAVVSPSAAIAETRHFPGDREQVRRLAVTHALHMLWRSVTGGGSPR